jgi:hypothetical protein
MFLHLRVQQVEVQLVFTLVVSQVTLTIHTGVPFGDKLIGITVSKPGNPAIRNLMLRNRAAEILQNTPCRWYTVSCLPFYEANKLILLL